MSELTNRYSTCYQGLEHQRVSLSCENHNQNSMTLIEHTRLWTSGLCGKQHIQVPEHGTSADTQSGPCLSSGMNTVKGEHSLPGCSLTCMPLHVHTTHKQNINGNGFYIYKRSGFLKTNYPSPFLYRLSLKNKSQLPTFSIK